MNEQPVLRGIDVGHAGMAALVMQIGRRDIADQLLVRRLGVDGIAGVDVALARCGLGNAVDLDEAGSFAVRTQISAGRAIGNVGQRFGSRSLGRNRAKNARREAFLQSRGAKDLQPAATLRLAFWTSCSLRR